MTFDLQLSPCDACNRWPADLVRPRCMWCPGDEGLVAFACVRCGDRVSDRGLRLCRVCDEGLTDLECRDQLPRRTYPRRRREVASGSQPDRPTEALPGSAEKIAEMARRAERGEELFHAEDTGSEPADLVGAFVAMCRRDVRGVYARGTHRLRWRAEPWRDGRHHYLGTFDSEEEAITAVRRWQGSGR